ncbi:hypothetical protein [Marinomonas sp. PE14-40]|uniref:hypothetical protein n=1 Tax=Marinomonas sp. PE14-40 TaxID=3060621 RepID=UPI003F6705BE
MYAQIEKKSRPVGNSVSHQKSNQVAQLGRTKKNDKKAKMNDKNAFIHAQSLLSELQTAGVVMGGNASLMNQSSYIAARTGLLGLSDRNSITLSDISSLLYDELTWLGNLLRMPVVQGIAVSAGIMSDLLSARESLALLRSGNRMTVARAFELFETLQYGMRGMVNLISTSLTIYQVMRPLFEPTNEQEQGDSNNEATYVDSTIDLLSTANQYLTVFTFWEQFARSVISFGLSYVTDGPSWIQESDSDSDEDDNDIEMKLLPKK